MLKWFPRWYLLYYQKRYSVASGELQSRRYVSKLIEILEELEIRSVVVAELESNRFNFWTANGIVLFNRIERYRAWITQNQDIVVQKEENAMTGYVLREWLCSDDAKPIILENYVPRFCSIVKQLLTALDQHEKLPENNVDYYHRKSNRLLDDIVTFVLALHQCAR